VETLKIKSQSACLLHKHLCMLIAWAFVLLKILITTSSQWELDTEFSNGAFNLPAYKSCISRHLGPAGIFQVKAWSSSYAFLLFRWWRILQNSAG